MDKCSIHIAKIEDPAAPKIEYMTAKWGRHPGASQKDSYNHPFNDDTKPLSWWPTPPDSRALMHEYWGRLGYNV